MLHLLLLFIFTATRECGRRCHGNHERLKKGVDPIVMKLHRNILWMFSCEFRIKMFQNATVAMVTIKVKKYFINLIVMIHGM